MSVVTGREKAASLSESRAGLQLTLLGEFAIISPGGNKNLIPTKKNRALLAVLALSPGQRSTRERLCGLLWSERGEEQARSSLRQSLAVLRKELAPIGREIIQTHDDQLILLPLLIDAAEILKASKSEDYSSLRAVAEFLDGELLQDTSIREEAFQDWLASERRRIHGARTIIFERLAEQESGGMRVSRAQKLVELDPLREVSQRSLIEAYLSVNEYGLALQQYERYASVLARELGVGPTPELQRLVKDRPIPLKSDTETALRQSGITLAVKASSSEGSQLPARSAEAGRLTIAVLPLTSLNPDDRQQLLADGLSEDIITGLARFSQLSVVARNLSFRFRGDVDVLAVSRELNAAFIVEGSLRRAADRVRVTVQLIAGDSGKHVWAESYDTTGIELFEAEDKVINKIIATLFGRVADAGARHARVKQPSSLAAYELVLQANAMNWETRDAKIEARALLQRAIELDPNYGTAHSLLAAVALRESAYHAKLTAPILTECLKHARRAIEIEPNDSAGHSILGWIYIARAEFDLAAVHLDWSERLNPNNPFLFVNRGSLLNQTGYPDQGLSCFESVKEIDPYFNPSWLQEKIGFAHFQARRYDECIRSLTRAANKRFYINAVQAAAAALIGDIKGAELARKAAYAARPDCSIEIVTSLLPCAKEDDRNHLTEGLRKAGFRSSED